ncbi:MAG: hypothetical protein IT178_10390 [Acidobacteria bacterium]|nr:hypothetical protein [Acidobacteriota bacterium]
MLQAGAFANYPSLLMAVDGDIAGVGQGIKAALGRRQREYVHEIAPLADVLDRAAVSERLSASLSAVMASVAVVLIFAALFGMIAYAVSTRRRELAVRPAVGASPGALLTMVVRDAVIVCVTGTLIGLPLALAGVGVLRQRLTWIPEPAADAVLAVIGLLLLISAAASAWPAFQAARTSPGLTLKTDN